MTVELGSYGGWGVKARQTFMCKRLAVSSASSESQTGDAKETKPSWP